MQLIYCKNQTTITKCNRYRLLHLVMVVWLVVCRLEFELNNKPPCLYNRLNIKKNVKIYEFKWVSTVWYINKGYVWINKSISILQPSDISILRFLLLLPKTWNLINFMAYYNETMHGLHCKSIPI